MKISKQARREAKQLFRSCIRNGLLNENCVRQAVGLLIQKKPRGYVSILMHLDRLVKLDLQRRTVSVESAVALPPELQNRLQAGLAKSYGEGLRFSFTQNPALLGGLRIKVGSDVFDGSVQSRLTALAESF